MMSPAAKQLTPKLRTKGKHRPHKMVKKKLPDGSGAIAVLPRRGSGRDAGALDDGRAMHDAGLVQEGIAQRGLAASLPDRHVVMAQVLGVR